MSLLTHIEKLKKNQGLSKHEQIVQGVIEGIENGSLKIGDKLPSINVMVREIGYARKTIVKAYEALKSRGLVGSKKLHGYYIISQETNITLRLALLLFAFQSFQEDFYNTFREELGSRYQIDVFFHHNNITIFETIISNFKGKYGKYVVAPIPSNEIKPLLQTIPPKKLLIVDRYLAVGEDYSYISQEFEKATYEKLMDILPAIKKYKKFILFYNEETDYPPIGILKAFKSFIKNHTIRGSVENSYQPASLEKGHLYLILSDTILWQVLRDCVRRQFTVGQDIGILSHNDNVSKEIAFGGITTFSTDFKEMAKLAAKQVKNGETTQVILPFNLFRRNSL